MDRPEDREDIIDVGAPIAPDTVEAKRENVRQTVTLTMTWTVIAIVLAVVGAVIAFPDRATALKDVIGVLGFFFGAFSTVIGFYFGSKK